MPRLTPTTKNITVMMWTKKYSAIWALLILVSATVNAQPGKPQSTRILIVNAHAHLGTGAAIEESAIGFNNGVIDYVGTPDRVDKSQYGKVIDARGKHVYPGFIAANTTLGLAEIAYARPTRDFAEVGSFNPNVRTLIAYNAESMIIPTTVRNGVLLAQIVPRSGVMSGTSSVVQLDAWNWEDAVVRADDGVHINWPDLDEKTGWYGSPGVLKKSEAADKTITEIQRFFSDAKSHCAASTPKTQNLRLEALCGVLNGSKTLYVHASKARQISSAVHFSRRHNIKKMVIVGGDEAWLVPEILKENQVSVMLSRVHATPDLPDDDIEMPYHLATLLDNAGVSFCLQNYGPFERIQQRNLPFNAGTTVAHGLIYEKAVRAISLDVARILGIEKNYGSLEVGKSATLFISDGDALDMRTNSVTHAFIDGRSVDLISRQEALFHRYHDKYSK